MTLPGPRRRWRYYRTAAGASPVREYLSNLDPADRARVRLAMLAVAPEGRAAARHLQGDIYEARAGRGGESLAGVVHRRGPLPPRPARLVRLRAEDAADADPSSTWPRRDRHQRERHHSGGAPPLPRLGVGLNEEVRRGAVRRARFPIQPCRSPASSGVPMVDCRREPLRPSLGGWSSPWRRSSPGLRYHGRR